MSTELECSTFVAEEVPAPLAERRAGALVKELREEAPWLPGPEGLFNAYGRVYVDCGHLELALCECDSPYALPLVMERQERLVRRAIERSGSPLRVSNCNHSGPLSEESPTWGAHENYFVTTHPKQVAPLLLPFLATRVYAGAGGAHAGTGSYLASSRALFMRSVIGSSTTSDRAMLCLGREEHHLGPGVAGFRFHGLLGDGKRLHFNIALHFGATALVLDAVAHDDGWLAQRLKEADCAPPGDSWLDALRTFNVLARVGHPPRVDERAVRIQRVYLEAARRAQAELEDAPTWIARTLADWERTLHAYEHDERSWLATRLDAFAKHALLEGTLSRAGQDWDELPDHAPTANRLALADHSWHEFGRTGTAFERAEAAGLLEHRVAPEVLPGEEPEPFVPDVATRARARARRIVERSGDPHLLLDWSFLLDTEAARVSRLAEPFAAEFTDWEEVAGPASAGGAEELLMIQRMGDTLRRRNLLARARGS